MDSQGKMTVTTKRMQDKIRNMDEFNATQKVSVKKYSVSASGSIYTKISSTTEGALKATSDFGNKWMKMAKGLERMAGDSADDTGNQVVIHSLRIKGAAIKAVPAACRVGRRVGKDVKTIGELRKIGLKKAIFRGAKKAGIGVGKGVGKGAKLGVNGVQHFFNSNMPDDIGNDLIRTQVKTVKTAKKLRKSIKKARKIATKVTKLTIKIIKGIMAILANLPLIGVVAVIVVVVSVTSALSAIFASSNSSATESGTIVFSTAQAFPAEVEKFRTPVQDALQKYGLSLEYTNIILAMIKQESGGNDKSTPDIMQSSEFRYKGKRNVIKDPMESIDAGVEAFKESVTIAKKLGITDIKSIIQGYNYGAGFLTYVKEKNNGVWTEEVSRAYSKMKSSTGYGDPLYAKKITSNIIIGSGAGSSDFVWPVPGSGRITCGFGPRSIDVKGASTNHNAIDIAGPQPGMKVPYDIVATASGKVIMSQEYGGYGQYVRIDHGNGVKSGYGHCSKRCVSKGDEVVQGQKIAEMGCTGAATKSAYHLDFTININGKYVDPTLYVSYN